MSTDPAFSIASTAWQSFALLQQVIDTFDDPIFVKDRQHRYIAGNAAFCTILGQPHAAIMGKSDPDFFSPAQAAIFWQGDDRVFAQREPDASEEAQTRADGSVTTIWTRKWPLLDADGTVTGLCGIITDITLIKQRQDLVNQFEQELSVKAETIAAQTALLDRIGVPVLQIWDGILLLPLIGALDSRRAGKAMEMLLETVGARAAEAVIIDITGVPVVDTRVAGHLLTTMQGVRLLGCQSILVGISPEIAQTLVGLNIDFSQITTRATLQDGLTYALQLLAYRVTHT